MADVDPREEGAKPSDPKIAAAEWLFQDKPAENPVKPAGFPPAGPGSGAGETFDLADGGVETDEPVAPAIPSVPPRDQPSSRPRDTTRPKAARPVESSQFDDEALVDVVWSRSAEWGPNLVAVAAWLFGLAMILYFVMGWASIGFTFLLLLIGAAGAVALSYPILITLERPVRITPEQAVRDFYAALSHHIPHFRRMWLLLARTGRTTSSYGSFEGFKAYWTDKIRTIKGTRAGAMTPLVFEVENFRGDKSAGKSRVDVRFTLQIFIRGHRQAGPISSVPGQISLVRGPDKMWYLESGTLPQPAKEPRSV
jgi:hypothetical protein